MAAEEGLDIRFDVGDCEELPYDDASFDVVSSAVGVIFAPHHGAVARASSRESAGPEGGSGSCRGNPIPGTRLSSSRFVLDTSRELEIRMTGAA